MNTKRRYNLTQSLGINQFFKGQSEIPVSKEEAKLYKNKLYQKNQGSLKKHNRVSLISLHQTTDKSIPLFQKDSCMYIDTLVRELNIPKLTSPTPRTKRFATYNEERSSNRNIDSHYHLEMSQFAPSTPMRSNRHSDPLNQISTKNLKTFFTGKPFNLKIDEYLTKKSHGKIILEQNNWQPSTVRTERKSFKESNRIHLKGLVTTPRRNKSKETIEESLSTKRAGLHIKSSSLGGPRGSLSNQQLIPLMALNIQTSPIQGWSIQKMENLTYTTSNNQFI